MTLPAPPPESDPQAEIHGLVELLHQTGQRLEVLTAGEVDAVSDQHAQKKRLDDASAIELGFPHDFLTKSYMQSLLGLKSVAPRRTAGS